jgi:mannose-6-phosphate isomerase-like protein (cupin superfamily)
VTAHGGRVLRFDDHELRPERAHDGDGYLRTARAIERAPGELVTFVDLTELPPGASVGRHTHGPDDEELYVVVDGTGVVELDGDELDVGPGDVVVNPPGGTHALRVTGDRPLRMVVVDVARRPATSS